MLEFFIIRALGGKIADIARNKGRSAVPYVLLLVLLWFGGEISGAFIGFGFLDEPLAGIGMALAGAAGGAGIAFAVVSSVSPLANVDEERRRRVLRELDDVEDDERRQKRRTRRERRDDDEIDDDRQFKAQDDKPKKSDEIQAEETQ
jgi:hypothetical protein